MTELKTVLVAADTAPGAETIVASNGGELLSGYRAVASFVAPADAVRGAAALLAAAGEHKVRVGVDAGDVAAAVEVAERICAAAAPGQALVTEAAAHLAGQAVSHMLQPAGGVRVPQLGRIVPVFAVAAAPAEKAGNDRMTTVVIADDQELLRAGFRVIIDAEPDLRVIGEAGDGAAAIDVVRRRRPDVVLMDIRMPGVDGLRAAEEILDDPGLKTAVVMLTTFDVQRYVYEALRLGASGFLLKDAPADRLLDAIRVAAAGEALLAPAITRRLVERFAVVAQPADAEARTRLATLTGREIEVLRLVARGRSNAEIARELVLGENTIKTHVSRVFAKLGLRDRAQAVVVAYETGLVVPGLDLE